MERLTSNLNLFFLERSLPVVAFTPERRIGVGVNTFADLPYNNNYTAGIGIYGVEVGHTRVDESDDGWSVTGRTTFTHEPAENRLLHLGLWGSSRHPDSSNTMKFNTTPESDITSVTFVNTGTISNVRFFDEYGVEAAGVLGPFYLQGEYLGTRLYRSQGKGSLGFKGWYGIASWVLTGESRSYNKELGVFGSVKPTHCYGAWEAAVRYDAVNLNSISANTFKTTIVKDKPVITVINNSIIGGQEHNVTLGLNWYVNNYVEFRFNYIKVYANQARLTNQPSIYTVRAQIKWE